MGLIQFCLPSQLMPEARAVTEQGQMKWAGGRAQSRSGLPERQHLGFKMGPVTVTPDPVGGTYSFLLLQQSEEGALQPQKPQPRREERQDALEEWLIRVKQGACSHSWGTTLSAFLH